MNDDEERWAKIPEHPGYEASTHGRIRNIRRRGAALKPRPIPSGYQRVSLGARRDDYIHRLVLFAFVGPCPKGMQCAHEDGNNSNNRLDNLSWKTPSANGLDKRRHGTALLGSRNPSWAGEACHKGHSFTPKNTRTQKRGGATIRVCRACAKESMRRRRDSSPERYRDGWDEKLRAGLDLMKAGTRAIHAARVVGVGRAALGKAWRAQGGPRRGRPRKDETI